ncbi:MAG: ankyrin repeat domain-containing protein [Rickettsiales bacterium]|jgi:ankyrin repeat protein|nr:ankyrin repeat domain-containing protein [Rickettsiales bacterium]
MTENEALEKIKSKFTEELKNIIGEDNLLEVLNILSGAFQNAVLSNGSVESIDSRNHDYLLKLNKEDKEELSNYFSKRLSLQGLFLIHEKAYQLLNENSEGGAKEVVNGIYGIVKNSELGSNIKGIMNDNDQLSLLNILANPKGTPTFAMEEDFEDKVLVNTRKLLNRNVPLSDSDKELALTQLVVDLYYSIHTDIKVDKDLALLLCMLFEKNLPLNEESKDKILKVQDNKLILYYIMDLLQTFHNMTCSSTVQNPIGCGTTSVYTKNKEHAFDRLSKNHSSSEFEKIVTDPKNIAHQYDEGDTILHLAALSNYIDIVNDLIKNVEDINPVNGGGETPLHLAAQNGHIDIVRALIEKGAKIDAVDKLGWTPLHCAVSSCRTKAIETLLEAEKIDVNATDKYGQTPLHLAVENGHIDIVKALIEKGANPLLRNKNGKTPRELATNDDIEELLKGAEKKYQEKQAFVRGLAAGCSTAVLGAVVAVALFATGTIVAGLMSIIVAVAIVTAVALAVGGITYGLLKPSTEVDKAKEENLEENTQEVFPNT